MSQETDNIRRIVDEHCAAIAEHVDSVQIFVTFHRGGEQRSGSYESGRGNFYARQGQVDEWLRFQRQYQKSWAKRKDAEDLEEE